MRKNQIIPSILIIIAVLLSIAFLMTREKTKELTTEDLTKSSLTAVQEYCDNLKLIQNDSSCPICVDEIITCQIKESPKMKGECLIEEIKKGYLIVIEKEILKGEEKRKEEISFVVDKNGEILSQNFPELECLAQ